jgi:hypothetical protein
MFKPDLVFSKAGRPIAVIEAKTRPIPTEFETAVYRQLESYVTEVGSPWALLVDPVRTHIFRQNKPFMSLPTEEVLREVWPSLPKAIGEQTLLLAFSHWLPELSRHRNQLQRHPKLKDFAAEVEGAEPSFEGS